MTSQNDYVEQKGRRSLVEKNPTEKKLIQGASVGEQGKRGALNDDGSWRKTANVEGLRQGT